MPLKDFDPNQEFPKMCEDLYKYVAARDDETCLLCGAPGTECHHVIFRSHSGKNKANNLATLCNICHYKLHNKTDVPKELLLSRIESREKLFRARLI